MTHKNKLRYHKLKKTHKNKRKSQLKRKTLSYRGGSSLKPNVIPGNVSPDQDIQSFIRRKIEYEEQTIKKGLAPFPTKDATFFKIIDLKNKTYQTLLKNTPVSLSYAAMRGKAFDKMKKTVAIPSNYNFKVGNLQGQFKHKNVFVSAMHVIIDNNKHNIAKFRKYLNKHKGYYLVVAHIEEESDGKKFMYRLPHRGVISCDGDTIVLMTTSGESMTYDITKENPRYRFIGLKKDDSHGEMFTMINALNNVLDNPQAFNELREGFLKQIKPSPETEIPKSDVKSIVRYHLENSLKDGSTPKEKETLKNLSALVHLQECPPDPITAESALTEPIER